MTPNPGHQPSDTIGRRVAVELRNGARPNPDAAGPGYPRGWSADGRGACRWTLIGAPHDVIGYEVLA